jgi:hypothetical protein
VQSSAGDLPHSSAPTACSGTPSYTCLPLWRDTPTRSTSAGTPAPTAGSCSRGRVCERSLQRVLLPHARLCAADTSHRQGRRVWGCSPPLRGRRVSGGLFRFRPTPSLTGALPLPWALPTQTRLSHSPEMTRAVATPARCSGQRATAAPLACTTVRYSPVSNLQHFRGRWRAVKGDLPGDRCPPCPAWCQQHQEARQRNGQHSAAQLRVSPGHTSLPLEHGSSAPAMVYSVGGVCAAHRPSWPRVMFWRGMYSTGCREGMRQAGQFEMGHVHQSPRLPEGSVG